MLTRFFCLAEGAGEGRLGGGGALGRWPCDVEGQKDQKLLRKVVMRLQANKRT